MLQRAPIIPIRNIQYHVKARLKFLILQVERLVELFTKAFQLFSDINEINKITNAINFYAPHFLHNTEDSQTAQYNMRKLQCLSGLPIKLTGGLPQTKYNVTVYSEPPHTSAYEGEVQKNSLFFPNTCRYNSNKAQRLQA